VNKKEMLNLAQILTIDRERLTKKVGALDIDKMKEVDEAIKISLGVAESVTGVGSHPFEIF
jgi:mRNA interferase MazF